MRKGLVELCVLGVLADGGEAYGYQILQRLAQADTLAVGESTVYPVLARLAAEQLLKVRTAPSPAGPPRRYYRLTAAGQAHLQGLISYWRSLRIAVDQLLSGVKS
jgi:PadR family transcriptional regulator PadR